MHLFVLPKKDKQHEIWGVVFCALAILVTLALVSFVSGASESNWIGLVGYYVSKILIIILGTVGSYFVPVIFVILSWQQLKHKKEGNIYVRVVEVLLFWSSVCSILSLIKHDKVFYTGNLFDLILPPYDDTLFGGYLGTGFAQLLVYLFNTTGAYLISSTLLVVAILLTTEFSFIKLGMALKNLFTGFYETENAKPASRRKVADELEEADNIPSVKKEPKISMPSQMDLKDALNKKETKKKVKSDKEDEKSAKYEFPTMELLHIPEISDEMQSEDDLKERANLIEKTLRHFDIETSVTEIHPGPVVTRFELQVAPGIKVNRIVSLSNDISLAMQSASVRILAPIPGKAAVGIELPNKSVTTVYFRELIDSQEFRNATSKLTLGLGKTVSGQIYFTDLTAMPHLLIAGSTGSGKSVCIHTLIASILYNATPDEVKLLLVDPKMVELPIYNDIPHLIAPVVTDPRKAAGVLRWLVSEMESRYKMFADKRVRNITAYNQSPDIEKLLPYLVVIVDELADLMLIASVEVEDSILRLAQLARAVGIHLILATQRPSVDVLTGVIKANFSSRIAFKTLSAIDSRIILDSAGAESLIGSGDMLFIPPGAPKPIRIQGAFLMQKEIEDIVEYVSSQSHTGFRVDMNTAVVHGNLNDVRKDELFNKAVRLIINTSQASISLLQRRLGIGYNRAARLIDSIEEAGIIGPPDGTKPRDILVDETYLDQLGDD